VNVLAAPRLTEITLSGEQPLATAPVGTSTTDPFTVSTDGDHVIAFQLSQNPPFSLFDMATGQSARVPSTNGANPVFYGPNDQWLLTLDWSTGLWQSLAADGSVIAETLLNPQMWSIAQDHSWTDLVAIERGGTDLVIHRLPGFENVPTTLRFSVVSDPLIVASDDARLVARIGRDADGTQRLDVGDTTTGKIVASHVFGSDEPEITAFDASPDWNTLALSDRSGSISTFDVQSGRIDVARFPRSGSSNLWLGYFAGGDLLFGADDRHLNVWDTKSGVKFWEPLPTTVSTDVSSPQIGLNTDLTRWAITDDDGMRVWNFDLDTWPSIACERAGRNLSVREWEQYMPASEPYHVTCPAFPPGT
jgi:WD40 repeat protein